MLTMLCGGLGLACAEAALLAACNARTMRCGAADVRPGWVCRALRDDRSMIAVGQYIAATLGPSYAESQPLNLHAAYEDSTLKCPIICLLSPGAPFMAARNGCFGHAGAGGCLWGERLSWAHSGGNGSSCWPRRMRGDDQH